MEPTIKRFLLSPKPTNQTLCVSVYAYYCIRSRELLARCSALSQTIFNEIEDDAKLL